MRVQPMTDRVAVTVIQLEEKTESGIITNISGKPLDTSTGKVIAIGPEVVNVKLDDTIALTKRCGDEIEVDGKRIILIKETNVLAVIGE